MIKHQSVTANNKLKIENEKLKQEKNRLKDWIDALLKNVHNNCVIAKEVTSIKKKIRERKRSFRNSQRK